MLFEIYKTEIEINGDKYQLRPLTGRYLPKLYKVMGSLEDGAKGNEMSIKSLNEEVVKDLHEICVATFAESYPNTKREEIEIFVSQNLLKLLEGIIEVNIGKKK